jgi:hypothetical protein
MLFLALLTFCKNSYMISKRHMKRKRCPQEKSITCQLQEVIEMLEDPKGTVPVSEKDDEDVRERGTNYGRRRRTSGKLQSQLSNS